ncbi:winged helix-turn-helix domain-containing protein [Methanobrevibacter curvatus]|uniref:Bacterial regulatory protein, arsR family n=1 Tax=Methanobrevibacter curvatus TaxID=49547 RepID=A0A166C438_9EURY|nr:winged helix-turn-helix domain-containing protein [Methanobrevibacter curvatus]KZX11077.1 bacterial regulatory protein, arsR family [Methanobrevibacter curvatus]
MNNKTNKLHNENNTNNSTNNNTFNSSDDFSQNQIYEIKNMISDVHKDLKNMIEKSNEEYLHLMYENLKNEFIGSINGYMVDRIDSDLDSRLVDPCDMRHQCKKVFKQYLKQHTSDLNPDTINEEKIAKSRDDFEEIKKVKQKDDCDICFDEVSNIFETQIDLIKSLKIYNAQEEEDEKKISSIDEENIVENILDPISHEKRLKILKSIALKPHTFSELSKLTNLRGGNLIFHLKKLQNTDLIFQKKDHGEYILSSKGFQIIQLLLNFD